MKLEIANILTDEKQKLNGFKILGVFPFYLKFIRMSTHVKLCKVREEINLISDKKEISVDDFFNSELQEKLVPLLQKYVVIGLVNDRLFKFFYNWLLKFKIKSCGHYHILNLFLTLYKLNEPAFFLTYYKLIRRPENTLLKGGTP